MKKMNSSRLIFLILWVFIISALGFIVLFIAYISRFFNIFITYGIALVLSSIMFSLYIPNITNIKFSFLYIAPFHLALTLGFSLIFLMPIYRGVSMIVLLFVVFITIMFFISRSNISEWPIFNTSKKSDDEKKE